MSNDIPGLVETSVNLATAADDDQGDAGGVGEGLN